MTEEQQKSGADFFDLRETPMEAEPGFLKKERPGWTAGRSGRLQLQTRWKFCGKNRSARRSRY